MKKSALAISVIIPVFNEARSLPELYAKLREVLQKTHISSEIIFINDGSTDETAQILKRISKNKLVKIIEFRKNYGQTSAISAGIDFSRGNILVFLDADLQNDPEDIPKLLEKIHQGYDVVSGWRRKRSDPLLSKIIPSQIANKILAFFLSVPIHDFGCTLKAYKKEYLQAHLYGEMHRLMPYVAIKEGASITEIEVRHHPRRFGKSHYSLNRTLKVIIDMVMLRLFYDYSSKPAYVFAGFGLMFLIVSFLLSGFTLMQKITQGIYVHRNPIFLLSMFSFIVGIQFILLGFVAEFIMRTYFETQGKSIYKVRHKTNL